MGKGSNSTSQTQTTSADPQAMAAYRQLIGQAQSTAATPWNPNTAQQVAGFSGDQTNAFDAIRGGISQPYINQAAQFATMGGSAISPDAIQGYMNPWTDNVINATQADFDRQNERGISAVTGNARMAGSLGGDREQVAKALTAREQASVQSPIIANLRSQGYNSALGAAQNDAGRALQGAGVMGNLGQLAYTDVNAQMGIGGMQQQQQQREYDAFSGNAAAQSAYPFQTQQWLAGILGSATPNMGSTTTGTKTGPQPNQFSQVAGLAMAALPYLNTGGRIHYASGGGLGYVPQFQPQGGGGIQRHQMQIGGEQNQKGFADHFKEVQDTAKGYSEAAKGISGGAAKVGDWLNTTQGPGGWSTTVDYGSTGQNLWNGASNALSGMFSGFAAGGAIDENDPGGVYPVPIDISAATPVRSGIIPGPHAMPSASDVMRPPLMRQALESPRSVPDVAPSSAIETINVPSSTVGAPPNAGDPYAPPPVDVLNPRSGGIGAMPAPSGPPPAPAEAPQSSGGIGGLFDRFNNWRTSGEGTAFLTNAGAAMMAGSGVGGKGTFGVHMGQGLQSGIQAQDAFRRGEREKAVEAGKMKLAERAAAIRDAEEGRAVAAVPYDQAHKAAQTAHLQAQTAAGRYVPVDPDKAIMDAKTGRIIQPGGGSGDKNQRIFDQEFAKQAPKLYQDSAVAYTDAEGMASSVKELSAIAPYAETGFGQEQVLALRKIGARFGLDVSDKVAPTELFRALSQNFVLQAAQKLKPLSNSDVAFVQKGLATIESDPSTLKTMLPGMEAVAQRQALAEKLKMDSYRRGQVPDVPAILREVDQKIPSPIMQQFGAGVTGTTAAPARGIAPQQTQRNQSSDTDDRQKLLALPDGLVMFKGKPFIKNGTTMSPAPESSIRRGFFGSIGDSEYKPIPSVP